MSTNKIYTTATNGDIELDPNGTGNVKLGNYTLDGDQSVGSGQDNYVLTYDHSSTKISLEAAPSGGTTINNNADNRLITGSGTADTLEGEAALTFDGTTLEVLGTVNARSIENTTANLSQAGRFGSGADITYLGSSSTSTFTGRIYYYSGATWVAYTSASEAPQKALLGLAIGTTMASGFVLRGFVNPNGATGFTAGQAVFGATNASVTSTLQTDYQRIMGHAISTTVVYFNPSNEYIELT